MKDKEAINKVVEYLKEQSINIQEKPREFTPKEIGTKIGIQATQIGIVQEQVCEILKDQDVVVEYIREGKKIYFRLSSGRK